MRKLALLGSTGSIGIQTLDVVRGLCRGGDFPVSIQVLAARSSVKQLEEQIREFRPQAAAVFDEKAAKDLRDRTRDLDLEILPGMEGLCQAAAWDSADMTLNAVVGMVGLRPTLSAIAAGKTVALANKETLVAGGSIVMEAARQNKVEILPVDSEHSAIFQCLQGCPEKKAVKRLLLTASGGPFFGKTRKELEGVTPAQALRHPNWNMGAKVTIDSATLMNKGLEVTEAAWLFGLGAPRHPGWWSTGRASSTLWWSMWTTPSSDSWAPRTCGCPSSTPSPTPSGIPPPCGELDLAGLGSLTFAQPDLETFRCLKVCLQALERGGLAPAAANGANEEAVALFLQEKIGFLEIPQLVEAAMLRQPDAPADSVEAVLQADREARQFVLENA